MSDKKLFFNEENTVLKSVSSTLLNSETGKVDINGKDYIKIARRVEVLREYFGFNVSIKTKIDHYDENSALVSAVVSVYKNDAWHEVATGHAVERRDSSELNKYSYLENAETSAVGRSLACLGLSGSDEYASSEEVLHSMLKRLSGGDSPNIDGTSNVESKEIKKTKTDKVAASSHQLSYMEKLINQTETKKDTFLKHYNVSDITEMSAGQVDSAILILQKKKNAKKSTNVSSKENNAMAVLNENNHVHAKQVGQEQVVDKNEATEEVIEETTVEETVAEETAVEETVVEETAVEETAVEETAVEETVAEETAVDDKSNVKNDPEKKKRGRPAGKGPKKKPKGKKVKEPLSRETVGSDLDSQDDIIL